MTTTIESDVRALVATLDMHAVHDFTVNFVNPDSDESHPALCWSEAEWRSKMVDILVAGVGDPDSGCPQTLEAMRAFFGVHTADAARFPGGPRSPDPVYGSVNLDNVVAGYQRNPDAQLTGDEAALCNTIESMFGVVDHLSTAVILATLRDHGFVLVADRCIEAGPRTQAKCELRCIERALEDVLDNVLGLDSDSDPLGATVWTRGADTNWPDEGDAENGPPSARRANLGPCPSCGTTMDYGDLAWPECECDACAEA